jgi:hypothetical protein
MGRLHRRFPNGKPRQSFFLGWKTSLGVVPVLLAIIREVIAFWRK